MYNIYIPGCGIESLLATWMCTVDHNFTALSITLCHLCIKYHITMPNFTSSNNRLNKFQYLRSINVSNSNFISLEYGIPYR